MHIVASLKGVDETHAPSAEAALVAAAAAAGGAPTATIPCCMNHECADIIIVSCPPIPISPISAKTPPTFPFNGVPPRAAAARAARSRNAVISVATIPCLTGAPIKRQSASNASSGVAISVSKIPPSYAVAPSSTTSRARTTRTSAPPTARAPSAMTLASVTSVAVRL
jgi:hypothetical protein